MAPFGNLSSVLRLFGSQRRRNLLISLTFQVFTAKWISQLWMNHLIRTTNLSKMNRERSQPSTLVVLLRMASTRGKSGGRKHSWRNCPLTILCRENLQYHRSISILLRGEMTRWFLNQMLHRKSTIVLVDMPIVTTTITLRLLMLILTLTPLRGILSMVYLMDLRVVIIMFVIKQLLRQVLCFLLSHLLVCGWLRRTNSSAWLCLRWIRMGHGQWLH